MKIYATPWSNRVSSNLVPTANLVKKIGLAISVGTLVACGTEPQDSFEVATNSPARNEVGRQADATIAQHRDMPESDVEGLKGGTQAEGGKSQDSSNGRNNDGAVANRTDDESGSVLVEDDDGMVSKDSGDDAGNPPSSQPSLDPAAAGDPNVVVFRIAPGTGQGEWNQAGEVLTLQVGQTLRLVNDDTIVHRLHTGGAPCPHGTNFGPGETYDCVITRTLDPTRQANLYDHNAGQSATFYIEAKVPE